MSWLTNLAGSVAESFVGGAIGSLFGGINSSKSAKIDLAANKELWDYQTKNQYQNMVYDLNKAGINPMLAVGGLSSAAGGSVGGSPAGSDTSSISNAIAQKAQLRIAEKNAVTDLLRAKAEALQAEANAKLATEKSITEITMRGAINAKSIAETRLLERQLDKVSADIRLIDSNVALNKQQVKNLIFMLDNIQKDYDIKVFEASKLEKELYGASAQAQKAILETPLGNLAVILGTLIKESGLDIRGIFGSLAR